MARRVRRQRSLERRLWVYMCRTSTQMGLLRRRRLGWALLALVYGWPPRPP